MIQQQNKRIILVFKNASKLIGQFVCLFCALCGRYEISNDPERWLDINKDTGDITAKRTFNMRSPHVKNNIYNAVVKVTGQFIYLLCQPGEINIYLTQHDSFYTSSKKKKSHTKEDN